jgi:acetoin utilization protein AcuC
VVCELANEHCAGRIVATGGGGYAIETVVPRAWSLVWSLLRDMPPDASLRDTTDAAPPHYDSDHADINDKTMRAVSARALPVLTGWGLAF